MINARVTPALRRSLAFAMGSVRHPGQYAYRGQAVPGTVFYARYGGREYATAGFWSWGTGMDDQPMIFMRRSGSQHWHVDQLEDGSAADVRLPAAVIQAWGGAAHQRRTGPGAGFRGIRMIPGYAVEHRLERITERKMAASHHRH